MPQVIPFIVAAAEYIYAAAAAVAAYEIPVIGVTVGSVVLNVGAAIGLSYLSQALFGPKTPDAQAMKQVIRQATAPRRRSYGRVCDGGALAFLHDRGGFLYQIVMAQDGPIDGFEGHFLAGAEVTLNSQGFVTQPKNYFGDNNYSFVYLETRTGNASSAPYGLLTSGSTSPAAPWTGAWKMSGFADVVDSSFQLNGIATTLLVMKSPSDKNFTAHFPSGLPAYKSKRRGCKVWNPADETQSYAESSTWKWTMNGPAIVLDLITHPDGMLRLPLDMILPAIDVWQAQIALANTLRFLKDGGSEPWYQLSGTYELTQQPREVLPKLLAPMDARLYLRADGAVCLDCGQWIEPGLTISDDNIVSYSGFAKGKPTADIRNEIRAQYVSPDHLFTQQEADPLLNEASIAVDGLKTAQLDCTWAPSHAQTRYRMKIEAARQDPDRWNGTIVTDAYGLKYLTPEADGNRRRNIRFQIAELGLDDTFEVQNFAFDPKTGFCTFAVTAMAAADFVWNAAADEGTAPALPNAISDSAVEDPDSLTVTQEPYALASGTNSAIFTAAMPAPVQTGLTTILQWRIHNDAIADEQADWTDLTIISTGRGKTGPLGAGSYDVRGAWRDHKQHYSDYLYVRGLLVDYTPVTRAITPADFSASTLTVSNPSTGAQQPAVQVTWNDPGVPVVTGVQIEYRVAGTTNSHFSPVYTSNAENYALSHVITGLLPDTTYEWRPVWLAGPVQCTFGEWRTIVTPDARINAAQISDGAVGFDALAAAVTDLQQFVTKGLQDARSDIAQISQALSESTAGSANDIQVVRQTLSENYQSLHAGYMQQIALAAGSDSAIASLLTVLSASAGNYEAEGLFRVSVEAALNGAAATIALAASASADGAAAQAALYLCANSDGTSQVIVDANQFIVTDGTDFHQPMTFSGGVLTVNKAYIADLEAANLSVGAANAFGEDTYSVIGTGTLLNSTPTAYLTATATLDAAGPFYCAVTAFLSNGDASSHTVTITFADSTNSNLLGRYGYSQTFTIPAHADYYPVAIFAANYPYGGTTAQSLSVKFSSNTSSFVGLELATLLMQKPVR